MILASVIGTRPNIIKLAAMHDEIVNRGHKHIVIYTGQHYDANMSTDFFKEFGLPQPDYQVEISGHSSWTTSQLSSMLEPIGKILMNVKPDLVLIYGDTISSLAGALAAALNKFDVAHIEAGVRNSSLKMIENLDRILIDKLSIHNFCVSRIDYENLVREGQKEFSYLVGDVMKDLYLDCEKEIGTPKMSNYILCTLHRAENVDDKPQLERIMNILRNCGQKVIWPMHPRTAKMITHYEIPLSSNLVIQPPITYKDLMRLVKGASLVMTDSGGLQKEAYWAKKPCLVLWDTPIWPEIYETGYQELTTDMDKAAKLLNGWEVNPDNYDRYLYGHGDTRELIMNIIEREAIK